MAMLYKMGIWEGFGMEELLRAVDFSGKLWPPSTEALSGLLSK